MFTKIYNVFTGGLMVLLVSMLGVNYLPKDLFGDFPFDPKTRDSIDFDSVIPQWNTKLSDGNPEYILLNKIIGPESIAISDNGLWYTGLADGRFLEIDPSKDYRSRQVLRFNKSPVCKDNDNMRAEECGRFLQVRFFNGSLYGVEAKNGLYKIDIKSGTKTGLGPNGIGFNFYNSFVFDPKQPNLVYLTVTSSKWGLQKIVWSFIELESSGKLIALDIKTGKTVTILDGLMGTNGIEVDPKRDRLIFAELSSSQINYLSLEQTRSEFEKAKSGSTLDSVQKKSLIPITPGNPDNIIVNGDLAYIALPFVRAKGRELVDILSQSPRVKMAFARLVYGTGKILEYVHEKLFQHPLLDGLYRDLISGHFFYKVMPGEKSAVLEYNLATGSSRILGSEAFSFVSEAVPDGKGNLVLGSFRSPFIVKVKL